MKTKQEYIDDVRAMIKSHDWREFRNILVEAIKAEDLHPIQLIAIGCSISQLRRRGDPREREIVIEPLGKQGTIQ